MKLGEFRKITEDLPDDMPFGLIDATTDDTDNMNYAITPDMVEVGDCYDNDEDSETYGQPKGQMLFITFENQLNENSILVPDEVWEKSKIHLDENVAMILLKNGFKKPAAFTYVNQLCKIEVKKHWIEISDGDGKDVNAIHSMNLYELIGFLIINDFMPPFFLKTSVWNHKIKSDK